MGYLIKTVLGAGLFIAGVVVFNVKLVSLLETGTCASGNTPYQISQPCPSGTGTDILLLFVSLLGGGIGCLLFANRGNPPGGREQFDVQGDFTFGFLAWGLFFTATGGTSLYASLTNDAIKASSGGQLGGLIVGGVFLLMGLPALILSIRYVVRALSGRGEPPAATITAEASPSGGGFSRMTSGFDVGQAVRSLPWISSGSGGDTGGQIDRLERLQKLHQSGALTDAEFEREKAKILSE